MINTEKMQALTTIKCAISHGQNLNSDIPVFSDVIWDNELPHIASILNHFIITTPQSNLLDIVAYFQENGFTIKRIVSFKQEINGLSLAPLRGIELIRAQI